MKHIPKYFYTLALGVVVALDQSLGPNLGPAAAWAQPVAQPAAPELEHFTLGRILEVTVRQRPSLAEAVINVEIADAAVLAAAGIDDWAFEVSAAWLSVRSRGFDFVTGQETAPAFDHALTLSGTLSRSLSSGGFLVFGARSRFSDIFENGLSASYTQPLLRNRGRRIARAGIRRAQLARDAAVLARASEANVAIREVIAAYWELAFALRDLEIRQNSLLLAQERLRNTEAGIQAGAVAPTEALAVRQSIATREQEIVGSELVIAQSALELRRLAGLEIGPGHVELGIDAPLAVSPQPFDVDELVRRAYAQSPTLAQLEVLQKDAAIEVELTENGLLPELDAALAIGPTGTSDSLGESLGRMIKFDGVTVSASLTYRDTIGRRSATGAHRRARAEHHKQIVRMNDVKAQIASAIVIAVKQAQAAQKRIELSQQAIELAEKNIEAEKARFELGRATNFDVLQRQEELKQAQLRQARAIVDYLEAVASIDALTGDITARYGITLDPVSAGR